MYTLFRAAVSAFVIVNFSIAQESKPAATQPAPAESKTASSPSEVKAREFLQSVASKRAPQGEPDIRDISIQFEAESLFEERHEFVGTHSFLTPNLIRTKITNNSMPTEQGFDGVEHWIRRGDRTESLAGREFEKDRKQIDDSINLTNNLLKLAALSRLEKQFQTITFHAPTEAEPRYRLVGKIDKFPTCTSGVFETAEITIYFDKDTRDFVQIRAHEMKANTTLATGLSETIEFSDFREVKNVRFPFRITSWTKNRNRPDFNVQISKLTFNAGLTKASFAPIEK
ncbi:MAG: hypothetical protein ACKVS6_12045 [Planctomycetota bacterium]